ncbi:hypothetical protein [Pseudorhodoferax soli]|jgi:hypothetical protein|uniref:Uncharacterized protein n=1 Tax=Pseudorhodoferax soli TaxID=545864 RepID=A0A368Y5G8_9BURK|nr:hypothetical protein [Pseudorhodoferax soli]RCW75442.1 hypothetical protein DES41_10134 [Pseudorhodoferax soli]
MKAQALWALALAAACAAMAPAWRDPALAQAWLTLAALCGG